MVRRLRKRKSCWHVIAIPQASIAAPTLTCNARVWSKKKIALCISFPVPAYCIYTLYSSIPHNRNPSANRTRVWWLEARSGVEDTRLKAKDTKKIRGQCQEQPFRGQTLSRPRTEMLEAKAKDQGHKRKCSPKKKGLHKNFSSDLHKKSFPKNFSSAPQNFNNSENSAVLEPRTGQFSRTWGLEAKAKDFKMCPRGRLRGQRRP